MKKEIIEKLTPVIQKLYPETKAGDFDVEETKEKFGDYSTSIAMKLAKRVGENPKEVAQKIVNEIEKASRIDEMLGEVAIAGPGFINFKIALPYLQQKISEIIDAGEAYGTSTLGKNLKINLEFISANPTGPITIGNGRGGFLGDALANILTSQGYKTSREYYFNNAGNQVKTLGESILVARGYFSKDDVYKGEYLLQVAEKIEKNHPIEKNTDPQELGHLAAEVIMADLIRKDLKAWQINFDHFFLENSLYENGEVEKTVQLLKEKNLVYEKDGALFFKTSDFGDDKDRVLRKSDGSYTYFAPDIAYHLDKFEKRHFAKAINILGADHAGYVPRLKIAMESLGYKDQLEVIIAQLVRLMKDGKEVRMSKRTGTYVMMSELVDEVGLDVARFFFLMYSPSTHMDFDLDLAKERSQKNPVYYIQYAYARIASILAKSEIPFDSAQGRQNLKLLKDPEELSLIKELIKYPDLLIDTSQDYQVQRLPFYLMRLTEKFHQFYENCRVIGEEKELEEARLELLKATQIVLKNALSLMGISAPEKM